MKQMLRFEVFKRDGFTCRYCGKRPPETVLEVDHIIPRSKGGTDIIENLVTSCFECNRGKSNRMLHELTPEMQENAALLKEKNEQMKAFYKYQKDTEKIVEKAVNTLSNYWFELSAQQHTLSTTEKVGIKNFLKTFTIPEIKEAMEISTKIYDFHDRFKYFCGILVNKRLKKDNPELHDLIRYWNNKKGRKTYYKKEGLEILLKGRESSGHYAHGLEGSMEIIDVVFSKQRQSYYGTLVDYLNEEKYISNEVDEYWRRKDEEKQKQEWEELQKKNEVENPLLHQAINYYTFLLGDYLIPTISNGTIKQLIDSFGISDTLKMIEYSIISDDISELVLRKLEERNEDCIKDYEAWLQDGYKNFLALCSEARDIRKSKEINDLKYVLLILNRKFSLEKAKGILWYVSSVRGELRQEYFSDLETLNKDYLEEEKSIDEYFSKGKSNT